MFYEKEPETVSSLSAAIVFALFGIALKGWILSVLWSWFVVPLGVANLGITQAIGLTIIADLLTGLTAEESKGTNRKWYALTHQIAISAVAIMLLLFGGIVRLFM